MPKRLIVDLDGTLTLDVPGCEYVDKPANGDVIAKLQEYHAAGFEIVIHTSRNMQTYKGSVGKINVHTLPVLTDWLRRHDVPHDEIIVGKPWCGNQGFYIDDKSIRPSEFVKMSNSEIMALLDREAFFRNGKP